MFRGNEPGSVPDLVLRNRPTVSEAVNPVENEFAQQMIVQLTEFATELQEQSGDHDYAIVADKVQKVIQELEHEIAAGGLTPEYLMEAYFVLSEFMLGIRKRLGVLMAAIESESDEYDADIACFDPKIMLSGALFRALKHKNHISLSAIQEMLPQFDLQIISGERTGESALVKDLHLESMNDPANYPNPDVFSHKDFAKLDSNYAELYQNGRYPTDYEATVQQIPFDLNDEKATFIILRYEGEMVGIRKIKEVSATEYEVGTFYVDKEFRGNFQVGAALESLGYDMIPAHCSVSATVVPMNPNLSRNIDVGRRVITGVVREEAPDPNNVDGPPIFGEPIFGMEARVNDALYETKNIKGLPADTVISFAQQNVETETTFFTVVRANLEYGVADNPLLQLVDEKTQEGYVVTRIYHLENYPDGCIDIALAFEKKPTISSEHL